jgi:predicted O-methyltransferase YrrM
MERLLYLLSAVKKPKRIIGLGAYYGYALVWAIGASCGKSKLYSPEKVYGVDIDEEAIHHARENFHNLAQTDHVELITDDGFKAVERLEGPFDYVYIDVDSRELGKEIYRDLIVRLYEKIDPGGWVLAHDTTATPFAQQLEGYLSFVRDQEKFQESISFHVDPYGLELSIK